MDYRDPQHRAVLWAADAYPHSVGQPQRFVAGAVAVDPVAAVQIADDPAIGALTDLGVPARDRAVGEHQVAGRIAAEHQKFARPQHRPYRLAFNLQRDGDRVGASV